MEKCSVTHRNALVDIPRYQAVVIAGDDGHHCQSATMVAVACKKSRQPSCIDIYLEDCAVRPGSPAP